MGEVIHLPKTPLPFDKEDDDVLFVHFINTNEGDCIFLEIPEKLTVESGEDLDYEKTHSNYTNLLIDIGLGGKLVLNPFLRKIGVTSIQCAIISHQDLDHCKDFPKLLSEKPHLHFWLPRCVPRDINLVFKDLINNQKFKKQRHFASTGILFSGKRTSIEIIAPTEQYIQSYFKIGKKDKIDGIDIVSGDLNEDDINNLSLAVKVTFCKKVILLPADIGLEGWANMMAGDPAIDDRTGNRKKLTKEWISEMKKIVDCDVLKLPHHGSPDTTPPIYPR